MKNKMKKIAICLVGALVIIDTVICTELLVGKVVNDRTPDNVVEEEAEAEDGEETAEDVESAVVEVAEEEGAEDSEEKPEQDEVENSNRPGFSAGTNSSDKPSEENRETTEAADTSAGNTTSSSSNQNSQQNQPSAQLGLVACINDCNADEATVGQVNTYLASTPDNIAAFFVNSGWTVHLVQSANSNAYLDFQERTISVEADADKQDILLAMGEFIDCATGYTSYSEEFKAIFNAESGAYTMNMDYTPLSWSDMYCDAVIKYYTMGAKLQTACPMTYSYVAAKLSAIGM